MCSPQKPKKRKVRAKTHVSFQDWETGLNPLKVGEDRVGDALDCLFEQSVEPLERWMSHWRRTTQQMKNFGELKDALKSISASCEAMELNLSAALERSSQRWFQVLSRTGPWNRGAPNRVVSAMSTLLNDWSRESFSCKLLCAVSSHLDMLRDKPISAPICMISATSEATTSRWPPEVTSSK